jgi:hypothetical protein
MIKFPNDKQSLADSAARDDSDGELSLNSRAIALGQLLNDIQLDLRYQSGLPYGRVRKGHPEGTIENHINEVAKNVELVFQISNSDFGFNLPQVLRCELLIVTHVHDTFKGASKKGAKIQDQESHASLARAFLEEFSHDQRLLTCVQYHDVPYSLYRNFVKHGNVDQGRLDKLLSDVVDLHLFTLFQFVDNSTFGKLPEVGQKSATQWFVEQINDQLPKDFPYQDVLSRLVEIRRARG